MNYTSYNNLMNEGGEGYNPYDKPVAKISQDWTIEVTKSRRIAYNAAIKAEGKSVTVSRLAAIMSKLGFTAADLRYNVARHSL